MRKLLMLLCLLMLLPAAAQAKTELTVTPGEMGFAYEITGAEDWVVLIWNAPEEAGRKTLYSPGGCFAGEINLPCSGAGGKMTVTVQDLKEKAAAKVQKTLPKATDYAAPAGKASAAVKDLKITPTTEGFRYAFTAPGTDYMLLYCRSKQENSVRPVYPIDGDGRYEGEILMPHTYARTQITVQVRNAKGSVRQEAVTRKEYVAPAPAERQEGRLSGVIVCVDQGHQELGKAVREPRGPGLDGSIGGTSGMAQGRTTLRKEYIVTLETGMILRDLLLKEGAEVIMTREGYDGFTTNMERAEIANEAGAHITLRLHCDTSESRGKTGISIFAPLNSDYAKALASKEEYRRLANILLEEMKTAAGYELTDKTGFVTLNDSYSGNNWSKMLCFLVEMGFMSNPAEDIKMATPEYQTILAQSMVEGIYKIALERGWVEK